MKNATCEVLDYRSEQLLVGWCICATFRPECEREMGKCNFVLHDMRLTLVILLLATRCGCCCCCCGCCLLYNEMYTLYLEINLLFSINLQIDFNSCFPMTRNTFQVIRNIRRFAMRVIWKLFSKLKCCALKDELHTHSHSITMDGTR